jgi:hydrogenase maturation protein HypF
LPWPGNELYDAPVAIERMRIQVDGAVQGVGFRPFVHQAAQRHGLAGFVRNDARGAQIEVEGAVERVEAFLDEVAFRPPPLARIERISREAIAPTGGRGFEIAASEAEGNRRALISPDVATCAECIAEIFDPTARRYRYAFTNCTSCGPRFTIVRGVPYDRATTTMSGFAMCVDCAREYADPRDRRFHAQPVCCPACGPTLRLETSDGKPEPGDPIARAAALIQSGAIVAVKGLGGYHLATNALDERAVAALRGRKRREERPFAVMVSDLGAAERLAWLSDPVGRWLASAERPIVLVPRRSDAPLADGVAPGNPLVGLMLPYTPLHHLLAREIAAPFVLTSGNASDEPIAYRDDDARERLAALCDFRLVHDRPIHMRCDDSLAHAAHGRVRLLRRSRGFAPRPLALPFPARRPILACGGELKNTICLAIGERAFVSHHLGDLEHFAAFASFREAIGHFERLFDARPALIAHDLHPEYLSTKHAAALAESDPALALEGVQHHHAHAAACLAESGHTGRAIAVCFDGLGYGGDGTLWGGELLLADCAEFTRAGALAPVAMPGGSAAIREPWRMALAHLDAAYGDAIPAGLAVTLRNAARWDPVRALVRTSTHAPITSSAGRLFDAVAALVGLCDRVTFEGQAAIALEQCADPLERGEYPTHLRGIDLLELPGDELIRGVVDDLRIGHSASRIAARFHNSLAHLVVEACGQLRARTGLGVAALSGGVFQNALLLERVCDGLEGAGFTVLTHSVLPANDGGLSFGQAVVAAARDRRRALGQD